MTAPDRLRASRPAQSIVLTRPPAQTVAKVFHLNWLEARRGYLPAARDILWSLSVEELFYLGFPIACVLLLPRRRGPLMFGLLLCAFVLAGPFARSTSTTNEIWQEKSYIGGMDAIALGCLTALGVERWSRSGVERWARPGRWGWVGGKLAGCGVTVGKIFGRPRVWPTVVIGKDGAAQRFRTPRIGEP